MSRAGPLCGKERIVLGSIVLEAVVTGSSIGVTGSIAVWLVGRSRRPGTSIRDIPTNRISFQINARRSGVVSAIAGQAKTTRMDLEHADAAQGLFILGETVHFLRMHNGYWIYIYVTEDQADTSTVVVAIKSKIYQHTFMLDRYRDRAANGIRASLTTSVKLLPGEVLLRGSDQAAGASGELLRAARDRPLEDAAVLLRADKSGER